MTHSACQLSIILPCFNVIGHLERSLQTLANTLNSQPITWEILIIDDGSKDATASIAKGFLGIGIKLIELDQNRGKYAAIKQGVMESQGEVIVFTDSDIPYGTEAICEIYQLIQENSLDAVVGDRSHPNSRVCLPTPLLRRIASKAFCIISSMIFNIQVKDTQCGLKGFKRETAKKLFSLVRDNRFGGDFELLFLANKYGLKLDTLPVHLSSVGKSSVNVVSDGTKILFRAVITILLWLTGRYPRSLNELPR